MDHRDHLHFKKGGGCLMLFGLPFFGIGVFFLILGLQGKATTEGGEVAEPWQVLLITTPFILVGGALMFGRAGVEIDRRAGVVRSWWGLLLPFKTKRRELSEFTHVSVRRKVIRGDKSTRIVFPVELAGEGDDIECESLSDYNKARAKAEEVAKFVGLNLHDSTAGQTVVHESAYLDESVADRARRLGLAVEWPELPAGSRIEYETVGESAVIRLPPPGRPWIYLFMLIPALMFVAFFVFGFLPFFLSGTGDEPLPFRLFLYGFLSLFIILPLGGVLIPFFRSSGLRETVAASWQGIQVERQGRFGTKKWTFPADELEELMANRPRMGALSGEIPPQLAGALRMLAVSGRRTGAPGLRLRSDKQLYTSGAWLSDEELEWLEKALTYILVNKP